MKYKRKIPDIIIVTSEKMNEIRYDLARLKTKGESWNYLINLFQGNILDFEKLDDGGARITVNGSKLTLYEHAEGV